jgi:hypothetical protein
LSREGAILITNVTLVAYLCKILRYFADKDFGVEKAFNKDLKLNR